MRSLLQFNGQQESVPRRQRASGLGVASALAGVILAGPSVAAESPRPAVQDLPAPQTIEQLRDLETRVQAVLKEAAPATVALNVAGLGSGSGVIVSPDGYILTAGHVIGPPGRQIQVRFPDGSSAPARTLGQDLGNDAGMAKLLGDGPWPFVPMATPGSLQHGDWTLSLGHPGGFDEARPVVARLGRTLKIGRLSLQSDCQLIAGDSGGPLLNLRGEVVGIHSRIGRQARTNVHVPVGNFIETWDDLSAGEVWGKQQYPLLGVWLESDPQGRVVILGVVPESAADRAGIHEKDIFLSIDSLPLDNHETVIEYLALLAPGDPIRIRLLRDGETQEIDVVLEARPE